MTGEQPDAPTEVVFISGVGSGIGLHTARALAHRKASIAILDPCADAVTETVAACTASGVSAIGFAADVAVADEVAGAVKEAVAILGRITTVVACTSSDMVGEVDGLDDDEWTKCVAANLTGVFELAKHTIPHLVNGGGSFVAVCSTAGIRGVAKHAAYAASAHGMVGLVRSMALDYGSRGVRCNVVCHGPTSDPADPASIRRVPAGRVGTPQEVAALVAHLTSRQASYTNGAVQVIDGGLSAGYLELQE